MALTVIEESDLYNQLSAHRAWLKTFNHGPDMVAGSQLSLVDKLISNVTLNNEDLYNAEIIGCQLLNVRFENCDLSYSDLTGSAFVKSIFINCRFVKADLHNVSGRGTDFSRSDFTRADLTDADLVGANLTDCRFDWAWLIGTDLRQSTLERTSFEGARLMSTKLSSGRKFELGTTERAVVEKVELSLGDNNISIVGKEIFDLISSGHEELG